MLMCHCQQLFSQEFGDGMLNLRECHLPVFRSTRDFNDLDEILLFAFHMYLDEQIEIDGPVVTEYPLEIEWNQMLPRVDYGNRK